MNDILLLAFHKENESLEKFTIMQRSIATEELWQDSHPGLSLQIPFIFHKA